ARTPSTASAPCARPTGAWCSKSRSTRSTRASATSPASPCASPVSTASGGISPRTRRTASTPCARWCGIEIAPLRRQGRQAMHRYDLPRRSLAYGIAGLAGFVDAAGFLAAGGYFVSFMSGNTTRLGVEAAARSPAALVPILLIVCFVSGVAAGAVVAERSGSPKRSVLMLSTLLIAAGAVSHALGLIALFVGASALAMGSINNAFRREGEVAVGVTYMTGALVRFAQGPAASFMVPPARDRLS